MSLDPLSPIPTTNFDAGSDNPSLARGDLFDLVSRFNQIKVVFVSSYSSLTAAVTAIGSTPVRLIINSATTTTADTTTPSTMSIEVEYGGVITNNYTLAINGPFSAGLYQVFTGSGAVVGLSTSNPCQFGAKGDGTSDDTTAFQSAFNAALSVRVPRASTYYKITDTITYKANHRVTGDGATTTRIVMTDATKWAFACDPVVDSTVVANSPEAIGGGFYDLDIRARYGIRLGTPKFANPPNYDYASFNDFAAASVPVQHFAIERCTFMPENIYADGYNYIAASPNWNTETVPTIADLYARGVGVLMTHAYRGEIKDCLMKFYGIAVWSYGSDFVTIENNRLANNLRHVNLQGTWTAGYQGRIVHNDLLANYRYGGVYTRWVNHSTIEDNYFENTGGATNSTINHYVVDTGVTTNILGNRFDDYGSTKTTGPIITFGGPAGTVCDHNRVADNRPSGAGNLAIINVDSSIWSPAIVGLFNQWGLVLMGENDNSFPRPRHPLVSYGLNGDPLEWSPLQSTRYTAFVDLSGGGVTNYKYAQDAIGLWYLNTTPYVNGIVLKPRQDQLTKSLNYNVTVRDQSINSTPFIVFWTVKWVSSTGTTTVLYSGQKYHTGNTAIEEFTQAVTLPAKSEGYFIVYISEANANLYSIKITEG